MSRIKSVTKVIETNMKPRRGYMRDPFGDELQREIDKSISQRSKIKIRDKSASSMFTFKRRGTSP